MNYNTLAVGLLVTLAYFQVNADIVVDGSTNTFVSIDSAGRDVIEIAMSRPQ